MNKGARAAVLIVEDDSAIRDLLTRILSPECDVSAADSGEAALALVAQTAPDLVLLDIGLPDMDGLEVCRRMRDQARLANVPVIFLTSRSAPEDEVGGFEAGGTDYISKPINPAVLLARVRSQLELKQNRDSLERMARLDGLTGIPNRRSFDDMLLREWRRLARVGQSLAVIMMDVDYFKKYNDTYGHGPGDVCLQRVASAAAGSLLRPADVLARYGGEEFVALLPETTLAGAIAVAEGIRAAVVTLEIPHAGSLVAPHVTISLGAACGIPKIDLAPQALLEAADGQLYAAKSEGRNRAKGTAFSA